MRFYQKDWAKVAYFSVFWDKKKNHFKLWLLDSIEALWENDILGWVCDHEMSKLIIKPLQSWGKNLIWVANLKFGTTCPVLEELLILDIIMRRSNSTIVRTVLSGLKLQPLIWAGAAKLARIPRGSVSTPTALQAIWARSKKMAPSESVLFISPANQPPPPPFSWFCSFHSSFVIVVAAIVTDISSAQFTKTCSHFDPRLPYTQTLFEPNN